MIFGLSYSCAETLLQQINRKLMKSYHSYVLIKKNDKSSLYIQTSETSTNKILKTRKKKSLFHRASHVKERRKKFQMYLNKQTLSCFSFPFDNRAFTLKPAVKFTCSEEINWPAGFIQMLIKAFSQIQLRVPPLRKLKIYKWTFDVKLWPQ